MKVQARAPSIAEERDAIDAMDAAIYDAEALLTFFADALEDQADQDKEVMLSADGVRGSLLVVRDKLIEVKRNRDILDAARMARFKACTERAPKK